MFDVNHDGEDWFQYLLVLLFHFPQRGTRGATTSPFKNWRVQEGQEVEDREVQTKNQGTRQESYWRRRWLELRRNIFSTVLVEEGIA